MSVYACVLVCGCEWMGVCLGVCGCGCGVWVLGVFVCGCAIAIVKRPVLPLYVEDGRCKKNPLLLFFILRGEGKLKTTLLQEAAHCC